MQYSVRIGNEATQIEATPIDADGRSRITAGGAALEVAARLIAPHHLHVSTQAAESEAAQSAERRNLFVARGRHGVWIWVAGRARLVEAAVDRRAARRGGGDVGRSVTPPMPAVVTKLLVELGQVVERGAALVVVSAMKMEMTLTAPHAGTVSAIHVQEGAKVNPGDILVDVEPQSEEAEGE